MMTNDYIMSQSICFASSIVLSCFDVCILFLQILVTRLDTLERGSDKFADIIRHLANGREFNDLSSARCLVMLRTLVSDLCPDHR
jgi:hypothetical protein